MFINAEKIPNIQNILQAKKKTPNLYTKLTDMSTKLKSELKVVRNAYLSALADKLNTNPKEVGRYIKSNKKDDTGIPAITNDVNLIKEDIRRAEVFNKYFHLVFYNAL